MKYAEAAKLKVGDLVVINSTGKQYKGLIFEIENIESLYNYCLHVDLKQPGYDGGFRIRQYDSRFLKKYEL